MNIACHDFGEDRMPSVILPPPAPEPDDHVKAWRLAKRAREGLWTPARFARQQCADWGIDMDLIHSRRGDDRTRFLRYILINRIKAAYPRLSSTKISQIVKKNHATVLFALGELKCRQPAPLARKKARYAHSEDED